MIADRIASYLDKINNNTINHILRWRPLIEYINDYNDNKNLSDYIKFKQKDLDNKLLIDESFFVPKGDAYLVLLSYINKESNNELELIGVFHKSSKLQSIPMYFNKITPQDFKQNIKKYIEYKKGEYSWETSDMFEFLDSFSETKNCQDN